MREYFSTMTVLRVEPYSLHEQIPVLTTGGQPDFTYLYVVVVTREGYRGQIDRCWIDVSLRCTAVRLKAEFFKMPVETYNIWGMRLLRSPSQNSHPHPPVVSSEVCQPLNHRPIVINLPLSPLALCLSLSPLMCLHTMSVYKCASVDSVRVLLPLAFAT